MSEELDWFLSPRERGNPDTHLDDLALSGTAFTEGNLVTALIHGANYYRRLVEEVSALRAGDAVYFTDWRGDPDEKLLAEGPTVGELLGSAAASRVEVRGLVWRSHPQSLSFSEASNRHLEEAVNRRGGEVLLDQRVLPFGSHHQKLFIIHRAKDGARDLAFVGGIDLCHGRRDDIDHRGDLQPQSMDPRYGPHPPWHDLQLEVRGPAVAQLELCFRERWNDPSPLDDRNPWRALIGHLSGEPRRPTPFSSPIYPPPTAGVHQVQVLRTYPRRHRAYPFARHGERSVARALIKAIRRARSLIYIEDQYLWSAAIADSLATQLREHPHLRVIAVLPRYPDADGAFTGPPNRIGQLTALRLLHEAGGERVAVFSVENAASWPIYVHAKVCIIDDTWAMVGSDNFNLRSWTHDSELACAILDPTIDTRLPLDPGGLGDRARVFARSLRLVLWAEHLGRSPDDPLLLDPTGSVDVWRRAAAEVADWHRDGGSGAHPHARALEHDVTPVADNSRWWVLPLYRTMYDPDGRSRAERQRGYF
jgi:phosphatidylserine/phosphatidylglycerophosphate/cardiolipin synthase-like enzyme